jgi:hypothetical protein
LAGVALQDNVADVVEVTDVTPTTASGTAIGVTTDDDGSEYPAELRARTLTSTGWPLESPVMTHELAVLLQLLSPGIAVAT